MQPSFRRWRPRTWALVVVASATTTLIVSVRRRRARLTAGAVVVAGQTFAFANARRSIRHALDIAPGRRAYERSRARAYRDLLLDEGTHHPALRHARDDLAALTAGDPAVRELAAALAQVDAIERQLERTKAERDRAALERRERLLGGFAPRAPSRRDDPLQLYGVRSELLSGAPPLVRDLAQQTGAVLDEIRLLHTAEIEWSTLLFTLWSRAALVALAPTLGAVTAAPVRRRRVWLLATGVSLATAVAAPTVATAVMRRDRTGQLTRRGLLAAEVPLACALLVVEPSWLTSVFAVGWTNWAQRPDFRWGRLAGFVGTVVCLQGAGMARRRVPAGRAAIEIAGTLTVIFYTGSSYGAILPLSASTALEVVLFGGLRQARAPREAQALMTKVERSLRAAAATAAGSGRPSLLEAADVLARNAARIERAPEVLGQLVETAYRHSEVPARRSEEALARQEAAAQAALPEPVVLRTPTFEPGDLRTARLRERRDAQVLHDILVVLIGEADVHGMGPLFVTWSLEDGRLVLRVANRKRDPPVPGLRGSGAMRLQRLAGRLTRDGRVDLRRDVDGSFAGLEPRPGWYGVQISCDAEALDSVRRPDDQ
jgi:hypothetical protein